MPETGFLHVPGGRIYYEVEGDGRPLLLIHGTALQRNGLQRCGRRRW